MLEDDPHLGEVVVDAAQLQARIAELGAAITRDYAEEPPLFVCVLKGAYLFVADLVRHVDLPVEVDFMAVSSYGSATKTSGIVRIVKDLDAEISGRRILIIEDIVDSGLTLRYLRRNLVVREAKSVEVCALLVKKGLQREDPDLRYVGFEIPPDFVVGYGLDIDERYRTLPDIHLYVP